jgi:hypothetical protein
MVELINQQGKISCGREKGGILVMKTAIMSDIHGNVDALKAVLLDIKKRGIKDIYNLGDSLYGPLFPLETYKLLV